MKKAWKIIEKRELGQGIHATPMAGEQKALSNNEVIQRPTWLRRPAWLFLTAIILRLVVVSVLLTNKPPSWGVNEAAGIAQGLILGRGFATPFHDATGPTAWLAPVYPCILAGIFYVFGTQTAAMWAAVLLNVFFASLTAIVILQLGREQFGERPGLVAAWAWAIAPPIVVMPWLPWETCLSALVMTFAVWRTLRINSTSRWLQWALCGCIWSFAALLNPRALGSASGDCRLDSLDSPPVDRAYRHDARLCLRNCALDGSQLNNPS